MTDKTVSEGASLPRSSAKVLRRVFLSAAAVLFALCLVLAAPAAADGVEGTVVDGTIPVSTEEELRTALDSIREDGDPETVPTIQLSGNIVIRDSAPLNIPYSAVIDGQGHNVTTDTATATADRLFRVGEGRGGDCETVVTFKNITVESSATKGRCIETRTGNVTLLIQDAVLNTTSPGNNQPFTVGGSGKYIDVTLDNVTINAGVAGYGITTFNPVQLNLYNSTVSGYAALYFKPVDDSLGSSGSYVTLANSTLTGYNTHNNPDGSTENNFASVVFEDDNIQLYLLDSDVVFATSAGTAQNCMFLFQGYDEVKDNTVTIANSELSLNSEIAFISKNLQENTVTVEAGVISNFKIPEEYLSAGLVSVKVSDNPAKWEVKKAYKVTWNNESSVELRNETVPAGNIPVYGGETPAKAADAQYTYTFAGWLDESGNLYSGGLPEVTSGDVIYTANFTATPKKYNITLVDSDESQIGEKIVLNYSDPIDITNPTKEGYTFAWNATVPETMPAEDLIFKAQWTANTYNVTFNANGGEGSMDEQSFTYDEAGKALSANTFERIGYTFGGWATSANGPVVYADNAVVQNLTDKDGAKFALYANWTANTYHITFNANDGEGTMADQSFTYDVEQVLTANAFERTGYTFGGWATSADGPVVYGDEQKVKNLTAEMNGVVQLYANWAINQYKITWVNETGAELKNVTLEYGAVPTYGEDPTKAPTAQYTYTFNGWDCGDNHIAAGEELPVVAGEATYKANFTATPNPYTVSFVVDGEEFGILMYGFNESLENIGEDIKAEITDPEKLGHTFIGWNLTALPKLMPAEDIELEAKWTVNKYSVVWYGFNDKNEKIQLAQEDVDFNTTPIYYGDIPTKAEDDNFTYTFVGWTPAIGKVTENGAQYTAVFTEVAKVIKDEELTEDDVTVKPEIAPEIKPIGGDSNEVTIIVTPSTPDDGEGDGDETPETPTPTTTTIVDTGKKSATIVDSNSGVKMEIGFTDAPKVTTDETTGKTGVTGEIKEIKVTYPVTAAEVTNKVDKPAEKPVTQEVVIKLKEIKELPTISSEFNESVEKNLGSDQKALAMITASHDNLETINANIDTKAGDGIVVTFTIPKDLVDKIGGKGKLKVFHVKNQKALAMKNDRISVKLNDAETHYIVEVKADGFSSYVVGYEEEQEYNDYYDDEDDTPATPVTPEKPEDKPTETPSDEPSDDPTDVPGDVPSDIPGPTPSEPGKSPAPILGVLAALGAAVVLRRK